MNKKLIDWWIGSGSSYTSEYQAILDRATALGYTHPSDAQKVKQNTLIADLKTAGIWTLLDVLYVFATDGSNDFALINWKEPSSYLGARVSTPTFTSNQGYNATVVNTQYLTTGWIPSTHGVNYTLNECGMFYYCNSDVANSSQFDFGARTSGSVFASINPRNGGNVPQIGVNSPTAGEGGTITDSRGLWHAYRVGSSAGDQKLYRNGTLLDSSGSASSALPNFALRILGMPDSANSATTLGSTRQVSVIGMGASLVGKESALNTAWSSYFTGL